MVHLIDKDALVTEIDRWIELLTNEKSQEGVSQIDKLSLGGRIAELQEVKVFLNTLETKEVDSIWHDARKTIPEDSSNQIICIKEDDLAVATVGKLVHGTKKWAYLHDLLNISNVQAKEVDLTDRKVDWSPSKKQMESLKDMLRYNIGVFDYQKFMEVNSLYDDLTKILDYEIDRQK